VLWVERGVNGELAKVSCLVCELAEVGVRWIVVVLDRLRGGGVKGLRLLLVEEEGGVFGRVLLVVGELVSKVSEDKREVEDEEEDEEAEEDSAVIDNAIDGEDKEAEVAFEPDDEDA
jgi:hypothetical protein